MKRKPRRREATPVAHMILSKRMADHKPHDMICELVDNALDADAGRVWIELGRRSITVSDDGEFLVTLNPDDARIRVLLERRPSYGCGSMSDAAPKSLGRGG